MAFTVHWGYQQQHSRTIVCFLRRRWVLIKKTTSNAIPSYLYTHTQLEYRASCQKKRCSIHVTAGILEFLSLAKYRMTSERLILQLEFFRISFYFGALLSVNFAKEAPKSVISLCRDRRDILVSIDRDESNNQASKMANVNRIQLTNVSSYKQVETLCHES
jgi:hypothetical protein